MPMFVALATAIFVLFVILIALIQRAGSGASVTRGPRDDDSSPAASQPGSQEGLRAQGRRTPKSPFADWNNPFNPANPNSMLNPNNPLNPASPLNPNNPANQNSLLNPFNPRNPSSLLNPNNPANPNSMLNPANPNSPLNPNSPMRRAQRPPLPPPPPRR